MSTIGIVELTWNGRHVMLCLSNYADRGTHRTCCS